MAEISINITVSGENEWEFGRRLQSAMDKLGYRPKAKRDEIEWERDLYAALRDSGVDPNNLVEEYRKKPPTATVVSGAPSCG